MSLSKDYQERFDELEKLLTTYHSRRKDLFVSLEYLRSNMERIEEELVNNAEYIMRAKHLIEREDNINYIKKYLPRYWPY